MRYLILVILVYSSPGFTEQCESLKALSSQGWIIHHEDELQYYMPKFKWQVEKSGFYEFDTEWKPKGFIAFSFDNTKTPPDQMYGDLVTVFNEKTKEIKEVRWFTKNTNKKHLIYKGACPLLPVPRAENTLF